MDIKRVGEVSVTFLLLKRVAFCGNSKRQQDGEVCTRPSLRVESKVREPGITSPLDAGGPDSVPLSIAGPQFPAKEVDASSSLVRTWLEKMNLRF